MAETKQISATIDMELADWVAEVAEKAKRSFSQTVEILLQEAKSARNGAENES